MFDNRTDLQPPYSRAVEYVDRRRRGAAGVAVEGAER